MKKLKTKWNNTTLRKKLIILLCMVGFVPVILLTASISVSSFRTVVDNKQADMENALKLSCASVDNQITICEQMMQYFVYDQKIVDFLECSSERKTERYGYYQELCSAIFALQFQNLAMQSVTIYSESITRSFGEETQPLSSLLAQPWFDENARDGQWYYDSDTQEVITMYRVPSYSGLQSYAVVRTDVSSMFQSFSKLAAGSYGVSVQKDGAEIWSAAGDECVDKKGTRLSLETAGGGCILAEKKMEKLGVTVICYQPRRSIHILSTENFISIMVQIILCMVIIVILGRKLADYISRPLELLTEEIQTVGENKLGTGISIDRKDEVGILIRSYNHMIKRIQDLIQENYETKLAQKEFEMKALQAQINPHFLYNSLSIINWKAIEAGENEISEITLALSAFYRTTLNRGNTMISIGMAIENIQAYLKLQLWMHDDDFIVHYEIDETALDYNIPSLIFQPIVENALEHGLDVKEHSDHQLWLRVYQDADAVYVEIDDNGVGMDEETLANILEYQAKGYGIKNVNDRMILHYGEAYGVRIKSRPDMGTKVLLTFPKGGVQCLKHRNKRKIIILTALCAIVIVCIAAGCVMARSRQNDGTHKKALQEAYAKAAGDPTAPYPETVTYKLLKMTASGDPLMPEGDTYENNAYTRFLKDFLNVQNENVAEVSEDENYDLYVKRLISEGQIPDVMLVSDADEVKKLAADGVIADLTTAYEQCTSDTIKEIYDSYGSELLESVTVDGKLMALPSTQVYYGCSMFWVRQDWLDELGLSEPKTLADVERIVLAFKENNMGGEGNIGLACMADLVGTGSSNYMLDPVFGAFGAYPRIWVEDENGKQVYGSLSAETKEALAFLNDWYEKGVLDEDYMMRSTTELGNLVIDGHCGAFFGWWWAPNSPLLSSVSADSGAVWKPYLIGDDDGRVNSYVYAKGTQYVVVRKGYEHPELVMKITTALFDNARFGDDATEEIDEYQVIGVDITARPLVINCDYSDAVFRTTDRIEAALRGEEDPVHLSSLERAYYGACESYLAGEEKPDYWAAYASRIEAVGLMNENADRISYVNEDYVPSSNRDVPEELADMETLAFMKIITGEEDISYFDKFCEDWKKNIILENLSY